MKLSKYWTLNIFFIVALICLNACRSNKKIIDAGAAETILYTSCYPVENIYVPTCKLDISMGNQSLALNGSIYIKADSICFFRGRLFMEVVRGVVYRDSFVVVDYLERICYTGKNEYLQKITGYPVNPQSLMMLFTADRCEDVYRNKLNFAITTGKNDKILMQGQNRSMLEMNINSDNHTIEDIAMHNAGQRFNVVYDGYSQFDRFNMPTVFDISANDGKNIIRIKANFHQILFNPPEQINMNIPSNYKVVVLQ